MITWRNGKGGFIGGSKHVMRGVFRYSYSITSATIIPKIWTDQTKSTTVWTDS